MTFNDDMKTILESMTWANFGSVPDITQDKIKNKEADARGPGITIVPEPADTETYQAIDGTIIKEIQRGQLQIKAQEKEIVQKIEDDLVSELPGKKCSIKNIDRPWQKNKYQSLIQIERLN